MSSVYGVYLPPQGRRKGCEGSNQDELAKTERLRSSVWPVAVGRSFRAAQPARE